MRQPTSKLPLADFQRWMQKILIDPTQPGAVPEAGGGVPTLKVEDVIKPSSRLAPWQHLAIYQHGYTARLRDCMAKHFMALQHALGAELFQAFADEYLHLYPSESYNLANLGDRFAAFLEATRPDTTAEVKEEWPDFMIELARFENAINKIFEEEVTDNEPIATRTNIGEGLTLMPGLHLFNFKFPVQPYYRAVVNGQDPDLPEAVPSYYAVFRQHYQLRFIDLQVAQFYLLQSLQKGNNRMAALRQTADSTGLSLEKLNAYWSVWLEEWLEIGILQY